MRERMSNEYRREATKPATKPNRRTTTTVAVSIEPRYLGERIPTAERIITATIANKIWVYALYSPCNNHTPIPTKLANNSAPLGGLKTSPWTNFQPPSSTVSIRSSSLYQL